MQNTNSKKCFSIQQAQDEAERCLLCHDAPCSKACPAGTDPGLFIRKLRMKNITGAIRTIKENNIVGGACGILCPTAELCEKACVACGIDRCIRIGQIQKALVEHSWEINFKPLKADQPSKSIKVAVIGSGPAGLSCAAELAKKGVSVTIFEQRDEAGGVLRYGVPEHRFSKKFLEREIADVKELGVEFVFSKAITKRNEAEELLKQGFTTVFIAAGLWEPVPLLKERAAMGGWFPSTHFLMKMKDETRQIFAGRVVTVIGGGSVAIDCAETAQRLGARDVYLAYRRSFTEMPAELKEREAALNSGIHFLLLNQPVEYVTDDKRQIRGIKLLRTQLGESDASGRRKPVEIAGSEWLHETDIVIEAIGSRPEAFDRMTYPSVSVTKDQRIVADPETGRTNVKGIYAGGDIVRGPSLIVHAVRDGKVAAEAIANELTNSRAHERTICNDVPTSNQRPATSDRLAINFCGIPFINPFLLSSSPVSNSAEMVERAFEAGWAGVAYKTICTGKTPIVHPSPRMQGYDYGSKKLVGLQNVEMISDRSLKDNIADIKYLKKHWPDRRIIASIMGFSKQEWADLAKACTDAGADMLELNFSCPHICVEGAGYKVGQADHLVCELTEVVKQNTNIPVMAKMTPNITDMNVPARQAKKGGADAIAAINTVRSISGIDLNSYIPTPNVAGKSAISGYSGPACKPIGLRFIAEMAANKDLSLPISGMGGIETWIDALEYILVGASTVQVTTGIIRYGYKIVEDMIEGLSDYMEQKKISSVAELVGRAISHIAETKDFDIKRQGVAKYNMDRCIGCGQCYTVCRDAGGQALSWKSEERRPCLDEDKCLSCLVCSFVCPVNGMIEYKGMPEGWKRKDVVAKN